MSIKITSNFPIQDYLFYEIGANLIPIKSATKKPLKLWKQWQETIISKELFEKWKKKGDFTKGYGIITGKLWRGHNQGKYLVCLDIDNDKGLKEFFSYFTEYATIHDIAQKTLVVQHKDAEEEKAHVYFITSKPITKRTANSLRNQNNVDVPIIEVKSDSSTIMIGPGSIHKNGYHYEIVGTRNILVLDDEKTNRLEEVINQIYSKYDLTNPVENHKNISMISEDLRDIARTMRIENKQCKIYQGNRNNIMISFTRSLLNYHYKTSDDLENIRNFLFRVNQELCVPPLSSREIESILDISISYFHKDLKKDNQKLTLTCNNNDNQVFENISDKKVVEYVVNTARKTIKQENSLVRLVIYTALSAYTKDPLNLGIMAPTSEGKTYAVNELMNFFPQQDVWLIGSMTPKVLVRKQGILVDENYNPIGPKVDKLIKDLKKEKDEEKKIELKVQLEALTKNSKTLIDLTNKVLVFLEPPHQETWNILKPVLSHDSLYMEHPYVFLTKSSGLEVKIPITKGWPACIFCSARDESQWSMWPEIQSRFFITSPNMIKQKYQDSNKLIGQRKGLPHLVQQQVIVSDRERQLSRDCILLLKNELLENYNNDVWIPYHNILSHSLPAEKGTDVRITNRTFSLLTLVTKVNLFNRPKLVMGNEVLVVATTIDLEEVLQLTHNLTGIPSFKLDFFINIFARLFNSKTSPDRKINSIKNEIEEEDKIALTTSELAEFYKKTKGTSITGDNLAKTYLHELENNGLIDHMDSKIDRRKKIYYPIVDISSSFQRKSADQKLNNYTNIDQNLNYLDFIKLKLSNNYIKIDENWLELQILDMINYGIGQTNIFKLMDENGQELCICQFIRKYNMFGYLNRYFKSDENCIYYSKVFGKIIKIQNSISEAKK